MAGAQSNAQAIEKHSFSRQDKLVLDANVWLFLHCPHGDPNDYRVAVYSKAYKRMIEAGSTLYIEATILGEFINRFGRLAHGLLRDKGRAPEDFKKFRKSALFKPVASAIAAAARKIMQDAQRVENGFAALDVTNTLADYETGNHDFNDLLIAELCTSNNLVLVTDDADFVERKLKVLTTQDRLV